MARQERRLSPKVAEVHGEFTHRMLHTRGVRLHVATAGDQSHPLLLLLHGAYGAWFDFKDVLGPLGAAGFHAVALDMRGYGLSDKPAQRRGDSARVAIGDLRDVITTLGHRRVTLVGQGVGGALAWQFAAAHPDHIEALVSLSAAHPADMGYALATRPWRHGRSITRQVVARSPLRLLQRSDEAVRRDLLAATEPAFHASSQFAQTLQLRQRAARIDHAWPNLSAAPRLLTQRAANSAHPVTAPVLLLQPPGFGGAVLARRQSQRATGECAVAHISGTKHLPHMERPERFVRAVEKFNPAS